MRKQSPSRMGEELGSEPESVQLVLRLCSCSSGQLVPLRDSEPPLGGATRSALFNTEPSGSGVCRVFSKYF